MSLIAAGFHSLISLGNLTYWLPAKPPPWRVAQDVTILKVPRSPAVNSLFD